MNRTFSIVVIAVLAVVACFPDIAAARQFSKMPLPRGSHGAVLVRNGCGGPRETFARLAARRQTTAVAHFNFPYALATDKFGNVFVANANGNDIREINTSLQVTPFRIKQDLNEPFSITVDSDSRIFAGNLHGGISCFSPAGDFLGPFGVNADYPSGIAADEFHDYYIITAGGVAIDSQLGELLCTNVFSSGTQLFSLTIGGGNLYAFYAGGIGVGNGSDVLRLGHFDYTIGSLSSEPVGSACTETSCWYDDALQNTLIYQIFGSAPRVIPLSYSPAGMAYDALRNCLFVADPTHYAVQVSDAPTLAHVTTIL